MGGKHKESKTQNYAWDKHQKHTKFCFHFHIYRTSSAGTPASELAPAFPAQVNNSSSGLGDDGVTVGFLLTPTPGTANAAAAAGFCAKPTVSVKGGWFSDGFTVTLASATAGATIYYTTDGSTPSVTNGTAYSGPVAITTTTVLRTVATKATYFDSRVAAATYLLMAQVLGSDEVVPPNWPAGPVNGQVFDYGFDQAMVAAEGAALEAAMLATPTLSIVTDQANLTDPATGIYTHSEQSG